VRNRKNLIKLNDVSVFFNRRVILESLNCEIQEGCVTIIGASTHAEREAFFDIFRSMNGFPSSYVHFKGQIIFERREGEKAGVSTPDIVVMDRNILKSLEMLTPGDLIRLIFGKEARDFLSEYFEIVALMELTHLFEHPSCLLKSFPLDDVILLIILTGFVKSRSLVAVNEILDGLGEKAFERFASILERFKDERVLVIGTKTIRRFLPLADLIIIFENGKIVFDGDPVKYVML